MKLLLGLLIALSLFVSTRASAHLYVVLSPSHGQTFALGSEKNQQWAARGSDHHLALYTEFTNDPYVDRLNPRQYDDFTFDFPDVHLGTNGHTFYYHPPGRKPIAVAERHKGFLGLEDVTLLDTAVLLIHKPHGYLTLSLLVSDRPSVSAASL